MLAMLCKASNGADALEVVDISPPDAIVWDLMLPVVHGWEFIERHRDVTHGRAIAIVVVSAAVTRSMEALRAIEEVLQGSQGDGPTILW
jgi:CheY-like chemotaxis protein